MKHERQNLLSDVLDASQQREAILVAGGKILRRKRQIRCATRGLALATVVVLAVFGMQRRNTPRLASAFDPAKVNSVHYLTDDELLALFPGTPVALGTVNGKTVLIFPRPGDEARFVSRTPASTRL